jgi:hypothetical protein
VPAVGTDERPDGRDRTGLYPEKVRDPISRPATAGHLICRFDNSTGVLLGGLHSPTQRKVFIFVKMKLGSFKAKEMSRLSFALLIVTGLALTAYFGAAAWRLSDDSRLDVTGQIPHGIK